MSELQSKAKKAYWASKTPKERSERMRHVATIRHKNMTNAEKKRHIERMMEGRWPEKK